MYCGFSGAPLALLWTLVFAVVGGLRESFIIFLVALATYLLFIIPITFAAAFVIGLPTYLLLARLEAAGPYVMTSAGMLGAGAIFILWMGVPNGLLDGLLAKFMASGAFSAFAYWYGAERAGRSSNDQASCQGA